MREPRIQIYGNRLLALLVLSGSGLMFYSAALVWQSQQTNVMFAVAMLVCAIAVLPFGFILLRRVVFAVDSSDVVLPVIGKVPRSEIALMTVVPNIPDCAENRSYGRGFIEVRVKHFSSFERVHFGERVTRFLRSAKHNRYSPILEVVDETLYVNLYYLDVSSERLVTMLREVGFGKG